MDLFVVNRYQSVENDGSTSKDHLADLLKTIAERKRQREEEANQRKTEELPSSNKKCKIEENVVEKTEETEPTKKKKKQKKKKQKSEQQVQENTTSDSTSLVEKSETNDVKFTVLGAEMRKRRQKIEMTLPRWLANPEVLSNELFSGPELANSSLNVDVDLLRVLQDNGISKLFPVQEALVKWILKCEQDRMRGFRPRDCCVSAPTGSGKTLAYVLPIVQILKKRVTQKIRCLIVLPVQELASQVHKVITTYASHTDLRVTLLSGSMPFEQEQGHLVRTTVDGRVTSYADIVVATPGRLIDHIFKTSGFCLDSLRFLVIDEADKSTDWMVYLPKHHVFAESLSIAHLDKKRLAPAQKLLFSATLSQDPEKLKSLRLFQPILFATTPKGKDFEDSSDAIKQYVCPGELEERIYECQTSLRPLLLYKLLTENWSDVQVLVLTNSREAAHRLCILLRLMMNVTEEISFFASNLNSKMRQDIIDKFTNGQIKILVSSDALARGLDIPNVRLVVSYDPPKHVKSYIHRIGRTGRAGTAGTAITIVSSNQRETLMQMLANSNRTPPQVLNIEIDESTYEDKYKLCLEKFQDTIESEKTKEMDKVKKFKHRKVAR